jgi:hypothetical protein
MYFSKSRFLIFKLFLLFFQSIKEVVPVGVGMKDVELLLLNNRGEYWIKNDYDMFLTVCCCCC